MSAFDAESLLSFRASMRMMSLQEVRFSSCKVARTFSNSSARKYVMILSARLVSLAFW